jgi:hypothetical protein
MQKLEIKFFDVGEEEELSFFESYPDYFSLTAAPSIEELVNCDQCVLLTRKTLMSFPQIDRKKKPIILSMVHEGTNTISYLLKGIGWYSNWPFIISSGDFDSNTHFINFDYFKFILYGMSLKHDGIDEATHAAIFNTISKPYKFLFLNGVNRYHRNFLYEELNRKTLLKDSLHSFLSKNILLPSEYQYQVNENNIRNGRYINNDWPDGQIFTNLYADTYFSLVTETNFEYPHSFRTEKIYKPLKLGHPFIVSANYGFYRDLHNLGYKTFGNLIDESFDLIENNEDRLKRTVQVVEDLCKSDLKSFLNAAQSACRYNRELFLQTPPFLSNFLVTFLSRFEKYCSNYE